VIRFGKMRWSGHVTRIGAMRNAYSTLVGKPEGKNRLVGRSSCRWEDNIKTGPREVGL
jgi:hypothetical protein